MAVAKTRMDTKLVLSLETGETKDGKAVTKTTTFSKIKNDASDEALMEAGKALASLQSLTLDGIRLQEIYSMTEGA